MEDLNTVPAYLTFAMIFASINGLVLAVVLYALNWVFLERPKRESRPKPRYRAPRYEEEYEEEFEPRRNQASRPQPRKPQKPQPRREEKERIL